MKTLKRFYFIMCIILLCVAGCKKKTNGPYFATGMKIGEVSEAAWAFSAAAWAAP